MQNLPGPFHGWVPGHSSRSSCGPAKSHRSRSSWNDKRRSVGLGLGTMLNHCQYKLVELGELDQASWKLNETDHYIIIFRFIIFVVTILIVKDQRFQVTISTETSFHRGRNKLRWDGSRHRHILPHTFRNSFWPKNIPKFESSDEKKNSTITIIPSLFSCFPLPKKEVVTKIRIDDSVSYRSAPRRHRWWNSSPKHLLWSRWHLKVKVIKVP